MISQSPRRGFLSSDPPLLWGLSCLLTVLGGCAGVGLTQGSDGATVQGGIANVCVFCTSAISPETIAQLKAQGITEAALEKFFGVLGLNNVPPHALDRELLVIAQTYLGLKKQLAAFYSQDPEVMALVQQARSAVDAVNFPLAERLFNEASQRDTQAAQKLRQFATMRLTSAAASQAANGDLFRVQLNFFKSQEYYRKALQLLPPSDTHNRCHYLNNLGISLTELGIRTEGKRIQEFLRDAVTAFRATLNLCPREQQPQDWAATQTNLGNSLGNLGARVGGAEGVQFLRDAVTAHRAALEVRTREQQPQDWAATQTNLGNSLSDLARRGGGAEGVQFLRDAVAAFRSVLEVYTREALPQSWAMTQCNLGVSLGILGTRVGRAEGVQFLRDAVVAHRAALEVRTREELPQPWAITQKNLGITLSDLGKQVGGAEGMQFLRDVVTAYHSALEIFTKENFPHEWQETNSALQKVLTIIQSQ